MKAISKLLIAGVLAMGTAMPVLHGAQAQSLTCAASRVTITDELAYRILAGAAGELEVQLNQSLSTDFLYNAYKSGHVKITYLGYDGTGYSFQVVYNDGSVIELLTDW